MATTMKLISKNVLGSDTATVTFSSIPGTYTDLCILASVRTDRAAVLDRLAARFNGASDDSNLSTRYLRGDGSGAFSNVITSGFFGIVNAASNTANTFTSVEGYIPNYAGSTNKSWSSTAAQEDNSSTAYIDAVAGLWSSTAAITQITFRPEFGTNFRSGTGFFLYGITRA